MKRVRVCLNAGCYETPEDIPVDILTKEVPVLFDDNSSPCMVYDDDYLDKMPVIGKLWYTNLYKVPSVEYVEDVDEENVDTNGDIEVGHDVYVEEVQHEDEYTRTLRGIRKRGGIGYEMMWKRGYEGFIADEFCDGKLMCSFYRQYNPETREITGYRCVFKKGNCRRYWNSCNVKVIEE